MNKKLYVALIGIISFSRIAADVSFNHLNIRTVNLADIMRDSEEGKKASLELEQMRNDLTQELEKLQQDFRKQQEDFTVKRATISAEARRKIEEDLLTKSRDIESKAQKAEDKWKYTVQTVGESLTNKAQKTVEVYGKQNNLDLVLDKATGRVLFASDKTDLTKAMITDMNSEYTKELTQAAKKDSATPVTRT